MKNEEWSLQQEAYTPHTRSYVQRLNEQFPIGSRSGPERAADWWEGVSKARWTDAGSPASAPSVYNHFTQRSR